MTDLRTAAQQALEALESAEVDPHSSDAVYKAVTALRAALADHDRAWYTIDEINAKFDPEPVQEPVAWLFTNLQSGDYDFCYQEDEHDHDREMWHKQPLYAAPPQRKPLAEWQINDLMADIDPEDRDSWSFRQGVYAAEKHHGVRK